MSVSIKRRSVLQTLCAVSASLAVPAIVRAQEPLENLKILVGFPPGSPMDAISRPLADKLAPTYAKIAIVDNRPGAAGRIAIDALKNSPPDGHTLLCTPASTVTIYPDIYRRLSYNPTIDLAPVSRAATTLFGLGVGPLVPAEVRTLGQLSDWAKANPDKASFGTPGEGSFPHILTLVLGKALGASIQVVPYSGRGTGPIIDMLASQIAAFLVNEGGFLPFVKNNRVRVLATSGETRSPFYPEVPTFAEQGVKELIVSEWFGLFAPGATPPAIVARASEAIAKALAGKQIEEVFANVGLVPKTNTPAELAALIKSDAAIWGPTIRSMGFKPLE